MTASLGCQIFSLQHLVARAITIGIIPNMSRGLQFLLRGVVVIYFILVVALWSSHYTPLGIGKEVPSVGSWPPTPVRQPSLGTSPGVAIPNIVHYVWVLRDPDAGNLEFKFKHFVSIYSSFLYLRPTTIYVHTNALPSAISAARRDQSGLWTRKIFDIPGVTVRSIEVPTRTRYGTELEALEHRSDFVRPAIMRDFGGIYLDFDVVPIRDMKPLRESGFRNVFGHELNEKVNNGVMLSVKGSRMMDVFDRDQHEAFDGWWISHSVHLLTKMANAMMAIPNEVLILERHAFIPDGWDDERHARLFRRHATQAVITDDNKISVDDIGGEGFSYWNWTKSAKRQDWEMDYSKAYTVHALSPPLHVANRTPACLEISWDYVMERSSNYAAQIYPAMHHADTSMHISKNMIGNI